MNVLIKGNVQDPTGGIPVSGTMKFTLNDYYFDSDGHVRAPSTERVNVGPGGDWQIQLKSTTDGTPSDRHYTAVFHGTIRGRAVTINFGNFVLSPSPTTQNFSDLIEAGLPDPAVIGTPVAMVKAASGAIDGANAVFVLPDTPIAMTTVVYVKLPGSGFYGVLGRDDGAGGDFTVAGRNVTITAFTPLEGTELRFSYQKA